MCCVFLNISILPFMCTGVRLSQMIVDAPCSEMNTTRFVKVSDLVQMYRTACPNVQYCMSDCTVLCVQMYSTACPNVQYCMSECTVLHVRLYSTLCPNVQYSVSDCTVLHVRLYSTLCPNVQYCMSIHTVCMCTCSGVLGLLIQGNQMKQFHQCVSTLSAHGFKQSYTCLPSTHISSSTYVRKYVRMYYVCVLQEVSDVGSELGIKPVIISGEDLNKKGFGGIYGVGKGAAHPPALAILSHTPPGAKKTIAWVGKGIVYDTGGLSLKDKVNYPLYTYLDLGYVCIRMCMQCFFLHYLSLLSIHINGCGCVQCDGAECLC